MYGIGYKIPDNYCHFLYYTKKCLLSLTDWALLKTENKFLPENRKQNGLPKTNIYWFPVDVIDIFILWNIKKLISVSSYTVSSPINSQPYVFY